VSQITKDISNSLKDLGIGDVINCKKLGNNYIVNSEYILFNYNIEQSNLYVSFHVSVRPDASAGYILYLQEHIKNVNNIFVMDSFYFDKDKNILSGKEAYKLYDTEKEQRIFDLFIADRTQKEFLFNVQGFSC